MQMLKIMLNLAMVELEGPVKKGVAFLLRTFMKFPFFKSIMVLGAVAVLVNCSDDESTTAKLPDENAFQSTGTPATSDPCWIFNAGSDFLIYPTGVFW